MKHKKLGVWLNPGGHVEENETPPETAIRETLEETGMKVRLIDVDKRDGYISTKETHEVQKPFLILYEEVDYKTEKHEHFDMIYIVEPEDESLGPKEIGEMKWFNESEIDNLDTFDNVKVLAHKTFFAMNNLNR